MLDRKILPALLLAVFVAACGSDDDDDNNNNGGTPPATETGVFIDSAVAGIGYRTETQEGETNADGEYEYVEGETVTFFIGDLEFPPVPAKGVVTPLDMSGSDDLNDPVTVNIARLLQTLDSDGDASNGITIPDGAAAAASVLDFDVSVAEFETSVANFVANAGGGSLTLVSATDAVNHLQSSLDDVQASLIGSWGFRETVDGEEYFIVLTFLDQQNFVLANDESDSDPNGQDGFELGGYTWNVRSGAFVPSVRVDTNGEWGLSHPCEGETFTLELRGDTLLVGAEGEVGEDCDAAAGEDSAIEFTRVTSDSNSLVGGWFIDSGLEDEFALVTFSESNGYMMVQNSSEDLDAGQPGIERGTYEHNSSTGAVVFDTLTDTNNQWGFSHP
ncbi:MAG TPA: hypothetical protein VF268_06715, partial [Gammaproteobacteria bacterium]